MTKFNEWCIEKETPATDHRLRLLTVDPAKEAHAVKVVAKSVPDHYTSPDRVASLLARLGRIEVARHIEQKLPTKIAIKSGDLGEILCTAYLREATPFKLGIKRLRWKDHRNMAMRGDDVLAFSLGTNGKGLKVLKAEVKSRAALPTAVIQEARKALSGDGELPSAHAVAFVADRLGEAGDMELMNALDDVLLKDGFKLRQVTHMLFTFSGNDPTNLLRANLETYAGVVPQHYVALRVKSHQAFIKAVFQAAAGV
ncbi:hypothetical protein PHO31112_02334 [Pandoraea horticolens]|uniref:Anti-bacteriophage protein A/HamA C-terminal domain-containing protein n=1 Tax=Pandoraea horticolens TaxID=2508298 RepID=A0A5E4V0Q7_9BURK|nr:Hachiman antiphage defense system protein HamA [Pandoraea horticolens]VVE04969.1 hypothetical protein PHO31112_02334 [Pandoraea horticolens]